MNDLFEPGDIVFHPGAPEWGPGQVQSVIGARITVNFEHAGKQTLNGDVVALRLASSAPEAKD